MINAGSEMCCSDKAIKRYICNNVIPFNCVKVVVKK